MANKDSTLWGCSAVSSQRFVEGPYGDAPWCHGVPASVLAMECKAARVIQKAWRWSQVWKEGALEKTIVADTCGEGNASIKNRTECFKDWSPWLFFDLAEFRAISQTSCAIYDKVSESTPFLEYSRSLKDDKRTVDEIVM